MGTNSTIRRRALAAALLASLAAAGAAAQQKSVAISVDDPRPVMVALDELEKRLGWVITYEDPKWDYAGDLQDRSALTGKALHKPQPLPRGGPFEFSANAEVEGDAGARAHLVQDLLDIYHSSLVRQAEFRVVQGQGALHVVPARAKDAKGKIEPRASILDVQVKLPAGTRSALAATQELARALSAAAGTKVEVFFVPNNLFLRAKVTVSGDEPAGTARAVLSRILGATGRKLSWRLVYLPDAHQGYALSVHEVQALSGS